MSDPFVRLVRALDKRRGELYSRRVCLAKGSSSSPCKGGIEKAHAISKSSTLRPIAENAHVLSCEMRLDGRGSNIPGFTFHPYGVSKASAFHGFCRHHDDALFSCFEKRAFTGEHEQCFALMYRCLAFEHYHQEAQHRLTLEIPSIAGKILPGKLGSADSFMRSERERHDWARRGAVRAFERVSELLGDGTRHATEHLVLTYEHIPPFAFAGSFAPFWGLRNERLQVAGQDAAMADYLTVSSITSKSAAHIVLSCFAGDQSPTFRLFRQIQDLPLAEAGCAVMELALEGTGTVFYSPPWVEDLTLDQRARLERLLVHGATYAPGPTPWIDIASFPKIPRATSFTWVA